MGSSPPIPAPGYRKFEKEKRPYLVTAALDQVKWWARQDIKVPAQALGILVVLCDRVDSAHGQFYGSWENLIVEYAWPRSFWFRWLKQLELFDLIEDLGKLPGRKTTTWQVLPSLYRLESHQQDTSTLVDEGLAESQEWDSGGLTDGTPLVSQFLASLVSQDGDTNIGTSLNSDSNISGEITISEEKRQKTLEDLAALGENHAP